MTTPQRRRKQASHKGRFQSALSSVDRWSPPKISPDAPVKRYALILLVSAVGGFAVFGGLSAMFGSNPNKELANTSHMQKKQASDAKLLKNSWSAHHTTATTILPASSGHKSIQLTGTAFVSGSNAAIREKPAINAKVIERAVFGSNIELLSKDGKWVQVRSTGQNISGWIEKAYLSF